MRSIRWRLLVALLITFAVAWLGAIAYLGFRFHAERTGIWDQNLRDVAIEILLSMPSDISRVSGVDNLQLAGEQPSVERISTFGFQVWTLADHELAMRAPGMPQRAMKSDFHDGFANEMVNGRLWRVYAVSDSRGVVQVQVGKPTAELASELASWVRIGILTTLLIVVLFALVAGMVVHFSLRPVLSLERAITARDSTDVRPLPEDSLPSEVAPLVGSFNELLRRVDDAVKGERQFLTDAAHELRTPLAAVLTTAQVALRSKSKDELECALKQLILGAERSARLSQQLLDSARIDADVQQGDRCVFELADVVSLVTREFESRASDRHQSIMLDASPCPVFGNVDDLGILASNLIDNAVRYSGWASNIYVSCTQSNQEVVLSVRDDGPGVAASEVDQVFERFFRGTGASERGSGIGLSLVKRIAISHGASITVVPGLNDRGFGVEVRFVTASFPDERNA